MSASRIVMLKDASSAAGRVSQSSAVSGTTLPLSRQSRGRRVTANKLTAEIAADLIIDFCNEHGELITNLRLQKLLYYAQAWHLGLYGKPLFPETFQAWIHGPAQPSVYTKYASFGAGAIQQDTSEWVVSKAIRQHIEDTMEAYGRFSAFDLERLACSEEPWIAARKGLPLDEPCTEHLDTATMKRFYAAQLNGQEKSQA